MPAAMGMTLFFLLFGGIWTQEMTLGSLHITTALEMSVPGGSSASLVSTFSESPNLNSVTPNPMTTRVPEKGNSTRHQISPPSSDLYTANEMSFPEASTAATSDLHVPESTVFWEVSTKESSNLEINANSNPAEPPRNSLALHVMTDGTMATGSLETSDVAGGPPVTMATGSLETSDVDGGPLVTMTTDSLPIPKWTSDSPISMVKIPTVTTSASSKNRSSTQLSDQGTKGTLLVAVFVALLVVIVLVVLLLLWRQRQKRRTGALTLSRGGKRNGVVDAWAGPAQVPDEEALTAIAVGSGAEKGSGGPEGERAGRQPTLTTFLDRGKSQQCSLGLEELKAGSAPLLKGEAEPLVGSKDEASEQPEAGEVEAPQCL
ncbi:leukosialin [Neomonachus schauinslandi]|uniref:Leukosialin n=1 Tax=Neomonachus schauinslandi TaxID=29088 RepID=A0A8M1MEP3_NEOSC|nr:leukosialin [Neomonachus schauinslandi]XP_044771043.1 leukosialin [Neomonachus schauinslandi]